jgi:hypothetical protein
MPTDNPKISAYVPQSLYARFDEFYKGTGLSMSQAATVIFAKFFGLEDIVKKITGETTIDNSALDRIKVLESQVDDLYKKLSDLDSKPSRELPDSMVVKPEITEKNISVVDVIPSEPQGKLPDKVTDTSDICTGNLLGELLGGLPTQISPVIGKVLEKRLIHKKTGKSIGQSKLSTDVNKRAPDDFYEWTRELDIDGIGWEYKGRKIGYVPVGELSSEQRNRLLEWIRENS